MIERSPAESGAGNSKPREARGWRSTPTRPILRLRERLGNGPMGTGTSTSSRRRIGMR
jgi:hypothetical protein